jgi:UDP-glucose 4-epimerase
VLATQALLCAALRRLVDEGKPSITWKAVNVGTGNGYTVLEMVAAMEKACGHKIKYSFAPRRTGDTEAVWAATELSEKELGFKAKFNVEDMCQDQWNWARKYPKGYE